LISQHIYFQKHEHSFEQIIEIIQHFEIKLTPIEQKTEPKDPYDFMLDQDRWMIGKNSDSVTWEYIDRFQKYTYINAEIQLIGLASFISPLTGLALLGYRSYRKWQLSR
jgi:hypothetical protein